MFPPPGRDVSAGPRFREAILSGLCYMKLFAFRGREGLIPIPDMSNFDSELPGGDWEERGELAWNEFDWERYFREQDESILRYLGFYESLRKDVDHLDAIAHRMGWETEDPEEADEEETE